MKYIITIILLISFHCFPFGQVIPFSDNIGDVGSLAVITNAITINSNTSTPTNQILANEESNDFKSAVTIDGVGFTINEAGNYTVKLNQFVTGNEQRSRFMGSVSLSNIADNISLFTCYIRNASGQNNERLSGSLDFSVAAGDLPVTVRYVTERDGTLTGAINSLAGEIRMTLLKNK